MRFHSYLNSAKKIIGSYNGDIPFSSFLKKYFAAEKKYGSKDRRQISTLCYHYYRLGKALPGAGMDEKIITATFLCENTFSEFLYFHRPEWNEIIARSINEKISVAGLKINEVFPWQDELEDGVDITDLSLSFLVQPNLFIRIRPGKKNMVIAKLEAAGIPFTMPAEDCIAFQNATKLDEVIALDKEAVVQDLNSQKVLNFLKDQPSVEKYPLSWDCCAASGGKSILLYDILNGHVNLAVSDIRESILSNLKKRFAVAGIEKYKSFIADLSSGSSMPGGKYPLIICDAPCTGSGTWSRTPEQLYYFKQETIDTYAERQMRIISNTVPCLQEGGLFFYITCSVFKKENEEQVDYTKEKFHLRLLHVEFLKGFDKKADSMFVAVFRKD
jgi:16S rRNA (cytosine967-C5)-methyltransferase